MMPHKELQELAQAMMRTTEYSEMMRLRKKIMENVALSRQMTSFEREHTKLLHLSEEDASARLKKLYADYGEFLRKDDVQNFMAAARRYKRLVSESIAYLNRYLDVTG